MDMRSRLITEGSLYDGYDEKIQNIHKDNAKKLN